MAFKCKNCGGKVHYNIKSHNLCCSYCNSEFPINEYDQKNNAEYTTNAFETNIFVCPTCGAEISSLDKESTAYCTYCGSQAVLKERQIKNRPIYIIPFSQTTEQVKEQYNNFIKNKAFVPDELKDPNYINEFRGIYIPYWSYALEVNKHAFIVQGEKNYREGNVDVEETYNINVQVQDDLYDIVLDASEALDDSIASHIAPYDIKDAVKFKEGYLAGFYSDKETTPPEKYNENVKNIAVEKIKKRVEEETELTSITTSNEDQMFTGRSKYKLALLPAWFLTYRKKDRVAYSVVNGQTGKIAMDLPLDKKKFFITAGIASAILSAVFFFLFSVIPPQNLIEWTSVITFVSSMIFLSEIKQVQIKESVVLYKKRARRKTPLSIIISSIGYVFMMFFVVLLQNMFERLLFGMYSREGIFVQLFVLIFQCVLTVKTIKHVKTLENKAGIKYTIFVLLTSMASFIILVINPVINEWFYIIATINIAGILSNCFASIYYFNYLTTRPIPNFFERKGGYSYENDK